MCLECAAEAISTPSKFKHQHGTKPTGQLDLGHVPELGVEGHRTQDLQRRHFFVAF